MWFASISPIVHGDSWSGAPNVFFITEHYEPYPYVLVRLKAIKKGDLAEVLQDAWCLVWPSLPPNVREVLPPKKAIGPEHWAL